MPESHGGTGLVTADGFTAARCPVNYDKAETHDHKQEANPCKTGSLGEREKREREVNIGNSSVEDGEEAK